MIRTLIQHAFTYWKIIIIVYIFQIMLAMTIGLQVFNVLESSIGHSTSMQELLKGYDYTIINDFLLHHGASITPLVGQLRWLILVYMIFSIFINAAILYSIWIRKSSWSIFFKGGADYFFAFSKLMLFFLPVTLIWTCLIWIPFVTQTTYLLEYLSTEKVYLILMVILFLIYIIGLAFLNVWTIASKLHILQYKENTIKSVRNGFRWTRSNYVRSQAMFFGMLFIVLSISLIFFLLSRSVVVTTWISILLMFIVQQGLVLFRIACRLVYTVGLERLYVKNDKNRDYTLSP